MTSPIQGRVLNCPSGVPFLKSLANAVYEGAIWNKPASADTIAATLIYIPSLSLIEPLKAELQQAASGQGLGVLPHIAVLGKSDPANIAAALKIAPGAVMPKLGRIPRTVSELDRRLMLTNFVLKAAKNLESREAASSEGVFIPISPANAYTIAGRIAGLLQEAYDEGVAIEAIFKLDSGLSSGAEQISLRLLRQVLKQWLAYKAESGLIEGEEGRNLRMAAEAEMIVQTEAPVIIAGSTGSIRPTFALMQAVLSRPVGAVVLEGLDTDLDAESWAALPAHPEHPQFGLHQLLTRLGLDRSQVQSLDAALDHRRARFLSQALRPAATTAHWHSFIAKASADEPLLSNLSLIEAANAQEEAEVAALILRSALEKPEQTAALVTPGDQLMERVRFQLARWGIGPQTSETAQDVHRVARFAAACGASGKLEDLIAFVRHAAPALPHPEGGMPLSWRRAADLFDLGALRQMWRPTKFTALEQALGRTVFALSTKDVRHPALLRIAAEEWTEARAMASHLVMAFAPFLENASAKLPFADWLGHHRDVLRSLETLRLSAVPEATHALFEALLAHPRALISDLQGYASLFAEISRATQPETRPPLSEPRLHLWHPLEARLRSADILILASLNEGTWPQSPEPDPWLGRKDRAFLGLSAPERRMGQAAHDFATLCAGGGTQVYLLRSRTRNGSLARPSRWLSRIKILIEGAEQAQALTSPEPWLAYAQVLRTPETVTPAPRPMPCPPLNVRPRRMSVTAIETWLANPYAIYARSILKLDPLKRLDERFDAREKGILVHAALERFFEKYPESLPLEGAARLVELLDEAAMSLGFALDSAPFWRPRFARFAEWFTAFEAKNRHNVARIKSEVGGKLEISMPMGGFEVTARADRIDIMTDGGLRIYDFKTSQNAAKTSLMRGAPQLAVEGLLAQKGAFSGLKLKEGAAPPAIELNYIAVTGGEPPGEILAVPGDAAEIIAAAYAGLLKYIERFDNPATPYAYTARAIYKDKSERDPYAHLARVAEWSAEAIDRDGDD